MYKKLAFLTVFCLMQWYVSPVFARDSHCGWIWPVRGKATFGLMEHNHEWRTFSLYVPRNYHPGAALILDFHGQGANRWMEMGTSCWKDLADREGAVVVYPQALGIPSTWNAGDYCCYPRGHDDEGFALQLAQCLSDPSRSGLMIDRHQVFAVGFSNGAAMAGTLACRHSNLFSGAAVASQSFPYRHVDVCRADDSKPAFPVLEVRGRWDFIVPFTFSYGWSADGDDSLADWARANQCAGPPRVEDACDDPAAGPDCQRGHSSCITYDNCANGGAVRQCAVNDDHFVYHNPQHFNICEAAWQMFQQQRSLRR